MPASWESSPPLVVSANVAQSVNIALSSILINIIEKTLGNPVIENCSILGRDKNPVNARLPELRSNPIGYRLLL